MKIKRAIQLLKFIVFVFFISIPLNSFAVIKEDSNLIRVGYLENYGITCNSSGNVSGYLVDYLNEIAEYTGWQYEYISYTWSEGLKKLESGEIDIFGPMQLTEERMEKFDFPEQRMGMEYGALYVAADQEDIYYNDVESFDGMRVGTTANNFYIQRLNEYCEINDISVEYVETTVEQFEKGLKSGELDAVLTGGLLDVPDSVIAMKLSSEPFYFATTKGNEKIIFQLNKAIKNIFTENAYFEASIFQKNYGNKSISQPAFTREEMSYLEKNPELKVVCNPDWAPILYYDVKQKAYAGFGIDMLQEMADDIGVKLIYLYPGSYEKGLELMKTGDADIMLGYDEQTEYSNIRFTNSIMEIPMVVVGKYSVNLNEVKNVGIYNVKPQMLDILKKSYPDFNYHEYSSIESLVDALMGNKEDYIMMNYYMYDELTWNEPGKSFSMVTIDTTSTLKIGVSPFCDTRVFNIMNKAVQRLTPEETSSITFANTAGRRKSIPVTRVIHEYLGIISIVVVAVFAGIVTLVLLNSHFAKKKLQKQAYEDELTGLYSLEKFHLEATSILQAAKPNEYVLLYSDIDNFKYINETYGYETGDKVLVLVSSFFRKFRQSDAIVGRVNADNFIILFKTNRLKNILRAFDKREGIIPQKESVIPENYSLTFSIGYYIVEDPKEKFNFILDKANMARKDGKDQLGCRKEYTASMDEENKWIKEVTLSMESALQNQEFIPYFQPKFDLINEKLVGAEALVRWHHPSYGLMSPARFIPLFEKNGFIRKLDYYMLHQVCTNLAKWKNENINIIPISVNLSRNHLFNQNLAEELKQMVNDHGIAPSAIEIELTESFIFANAAEMFKSMKKIQEAGFLVSIDDFGSGYSSLNLLSDFPANILKIDKGFVDRVSLTNNAGMVVKKVIEMAKELSLVTVAEGIETKEQAEILKTMGCDIAQGYYYGKPMPMEAFDELLRKGDIRSL